MTQTKERRDDVRRRLTECRVDRAAIWINDLDGRIVDELEIHSRIRSGEGGCQLCHEALDGSEKHGEVELDERGLPRLRAAPGRALCTDCVEWLGWIAHYSKVGALSTPRFQPQSLVVRAATDEIYEIEDWHLSGVASAGIWFPVYLSRRIEVREPTGEIVPVALGLEFELADYELQPLPSQHEFRWPAGAEGAVVPPPIDLVGERASIRPVSIPDLRREHPALGAVRRPHLPWKGDGT